MDATAEKLMIAVRDKIDSDELLREDLMVWSTEMGNGMAGKMYVAMDYAIKKIQGQLDAQINQQKEYVKKFGDEISRFRKKFIRICVLYGFLFGLGLGLLVCILTK